MNEVQRFFEQDVRERKALARQARYVKKGSRSTRCPMPSDYYTAKQLRERNGEIMSVNLARPIGWKTFKKLSMDIQKEYILRLIRKYGTNATDLGRVFGITSTTVSAYCKDNDFGVDFKRGAQMPPQKRAAFNTFLNGQSDESLSEIEVQEGKEDILSCDELPESVSETSEMDAQRVSSDARERKNGGLQRFRLEFSPDSNLEGVFNSVRCIVGDRTDFYITIEGVFNT